MFKCDHLNHIVNNWWKKFSQTVIKGCLTWYT